MVLDQVENFIRVSVAGGHASGDNTISLQSGEASLLPDVNQGKYNLIWWDSENFSLPSEDPSVEIVRVNSINTSNDTISVTRGQENTSATSKSTSDGEYSLILSPTAKTIEDIDANKLDASAYSPEADTHTRYSDSEAVSAVGASTPFANSDLSNSSVTVAGNSVSLGGSTAVNHSDLSNIGSSDHHSKTTSASELTDVSADSVSNAHHSRYSDSEAVSAVGASTPFANSDLSNSSVTVAGNSVSLGGSTAVNHSDLSNIGSSDHHSKTTSASELTDVSADSVSNAHHSRYSDSEAVSAVESVGDISISGGLDINADNSPLRFGANQDFAFTYDSSTDELVLADSNGIELLRQPKAGPTQFIQGADVGPISSPEDSFAQVINAPVTSAAASGDRVGYTFALDNQSILSINGEADGSGGIQNTELVSGSILNVSSNDIVDAGQIIWDTSSQEIPDSALGSIANGTLSNSSVSVAGNSVSLGGSTTVNHSDLSNIGSSDHHSKTTSASELTDVSADSVSGAHHSRYSDSEAVSAVESVGDVSFSGGIRVNKSIHDRNINEDITLSSNEGLVVAGPITGSGSISGDGRFVVTGSPENINADKLDGLDSTDFVQSGSSIDSDTVDGYDIQKNGTDGQNIINFKTQ